MSTIRPFRAIRYAARDVSSKLAPPYDVLDARDKTALLDRDPLNFVAVDLPHVPAKQAGPPAAYEAAARTLVSWLADGTLRTDEQPALYVYHQRHAHAGRTYLRKKFFAALRLEPLGEGSVFPHEKTFGGPKEDRLLLMKATRANLSPIFGLYEDAENTVATRIESARTPTPLATGTLDGVENNLWAVTDAATIADVTRLMKSRPTYIADGHHRYGTRLLYRDWLAAQRGSLPADHPANFVLCVFSAMEDPGLLILPTHRVLPGVKLSPDMLRADPNLEVRPIDAGEPDAVVAAVAKFGVQSIALFTPESGYFAVLPRRADILRDVEPQRSEAFRALALSFLHSYVLDRVVTPRAAGGTAPEIHYVKSATEAVAEARQSGGAAFLVQPTTMEERAASVAQRT